MFKRQNRLPSKAGFSDSKTFPTITFVLKIKENGLTLNRFGIIVSKKIDKRAVGRNKTKRMFRKILEDLNKELTTGHDMLFIVRAGIINKNEDQVGFEINRVLKKEQYIK